MASKHMMKMFDLISESGNANQNTMIFKLNMYDWEKFWKSNNARLLVLHVERTEKIWIHRLSYAHRNHYDRFGK